MRKDIWVVGLVLLGVSFVFDSEILKFVNTLKIDAIINSIKFVSTFVLIGAIVIYLFMLKDKKKIFLLGISFIAVYIISVVLKFIIMRERPEGALFQEVGYSFPSSHASVAFSTVALMNKEFPHLKWIFIVVALLITFSRVYLGVHYASDLIAGAFLGFGTGLIILEWKKVKAKIKSLI